MALGIFCIIAGAVGSFVFMRIADDILTHGLTPVDRIVGYTVFTFALGCCTLAGRGVTMIV